MEKEKIIKLAEKKYNYEDLEIIKKILNKNYETSYGLYEPEELKKALSEKNPIVIKNNLIIGFDLNGKFINSNNEKISIERMIKAIIVEDERENIDNFESPYFAIIGKNEWEEDILYDFKEIIGRLKIGEVWLPSHSVIFNFLNLKQDKEIVSELIGIHINIYSPENYIDNCFHEIGHLFWKEQLNFEERQDFKQLFERLKPSAIYVFEWEKTSPEEIFCTIYKWYVKSILLNKSFYNILAYEEPQGLTLLENIFTRIEKDRITDDIWDMNKDLITDYINPKFDKTTGKYLRKAGAFEKIKNILIPGKVLNNIDRFENGIEFIDLGKAIVPVKGNKIEYSLLQKAITREKPIIYFDMDGVIADFAGAYKDIFFRSAYEDDPFTVNQMCVTIPDFFRLLPVLPKGKELFDLLKDKYKIIFLTTPMPGMDTCRRDKIEWVKQHFGNYDIIFSDNKAEYVLDEKSILIDDMQYNLDPWTEAGGTAINFNKPNNKIIEIIDNVLNGEKHINIIKKQFLEMDVDTNPTQAQKESGNYKKGEITFKNMKIKIENPKGSVRWGFNDSGKKWIQRMKHHYGYIAGSEGADTDSVDVFIGPNLNASRAFVVNQINPESNMFDEHKIILGANDIDEAKNIYMSNYRKDWQGFDSIKQTNTKKLREWLKDGNKNEPF